MLNSSARPPCSLMACARWRSKPACRSAATVSAACSACFSRRKKSKPTPRPWPAMSLRSIASSTPCSSAAYIWRHQPSKRPSCRPHTAKRISPTRCKPPAPLSSRCATPMRLESLAVHTGAEPDAATGAVATPLHLSTTFQHGPAGERVAGFEYVREGNPNQERLETALAALEGGAGALAFASGMAAITALLESLPAATHFIYPQDCYTGLRVLAAEFLPQRGVSATAVESADLNAVRAAITPHTRCLWLETPSNPQLRICDIAALSKLSHEHGAVVACDNTFATPLLQQPLALGADVVMHSTTKYFGGHSDALGGALIFARRDELLDAVAHRRHITGGVLSPFNAWLTLRGLRSLPARMAWHCRNARAVAEFLAAHPRVVVVPCPGLP